MEKTTPHKRIIQGRVVTKTGDKSATIIVTRQVMHPRYHKYIKRFKKYIIHDEANELGINDEVEAIECRPLSKRKAFTLNKVLKKGVVL